MSEKFEKEKINKTSAESSEQQAEFELERPNDHEKRIVHNTEELINAIKEKFFPRTIKETAKLHERFNVNVGKVMEELRLEELDKNLFPLNTDKQLLYLENGKDTWFENVKNYWYNKNNYDKQRLEYYKGKKFSDLEKKLFDAIDLGKAIQLHHNATKVFPYLVGKIVETDNILKENILKSIDYERGGSHTLECPDYLTPRDKTIKDYHPLLMPFKDILTQLENQGTKELPDWLREQGEMAGYSTVYQDMIKTVQLLAEKSGDDADTRMKEFAIIEKKIHKEQSDADAPHSK
jgi:hypothetical protein